MRGEGGGDQGEEAAVRLALEGVPALAEGGHVAVRLAQRRGGVRLRKSRGVRIMNALITLRFCFHNSFLVVVFSLFK